LGYRSWEDGIRVYKSRLSLLSRTKNILSTTNMVRKNNINPTTDAAALEAHPALDSHPEKHKDHSEFLRDAIIGFADGLTVPFALTAGLTA
jgi:hypothetical protein